jgi:phytoene desaturase
MTDKKQEKRKVAVIGAGLGGLASAVQLAHAGCEVTVFEKNDRAGGRINPVAEGGFIWDAGQSMLTLPQTLREFWQGVGRQLEDYLTLLPLDPVCRYHWHDGTLIDENHLFLERPDVRNYLEYAGGILKILGPDFFRHPLDEYQRWLNPFNPSILRHLPKIFSWKNMDSLSRRFFSDPHLVRIFNHAATRLGSSPYLTPSVFCLHSYLRSKSGGWYVKGGLHQIAGAFLKLAQEFGVEIRTNAEITGFHVHGRHYHVAQEGKWETFDGVVCNLDALHAYEHLLPRAAGESFRRQHLGRLPLSSSAFLLFLGVKKKYGGLAHHNVFFSDDPVREFHQLFTERQPMDRPTISVTVSSRTEPGHAPEGCDNWMVHVSAPALRSRSSWKNVSESYGNRIIEMLEDYGFAGLKDEIIVRRCFTPSNFRSRYRAYAGSLHGFASHGLLTPLKRPFAGPDGWKSFAFAGCSTQHGGGIPMVILGAEMAAGKVLHDMQKGE